MMRHHPSLLLLGVLLAAPLHAQIGGRYWPPADRAVISSYLNITAVAASADRVYALSSGGVVLLHPRIRALDGPYLLPDPVILGGATAALVADLRGGLQRPLLVPGDVPAEIFDLTLDERYLWLATADGLVRFRLDAIR